MLVLCGWCKRFVKEVDGPVHWVTHECCPICKEAVELSWNPERETMPCACGNPEFGFPCVCGFTHDHPGDIEFTCEFCGIYTASQARCSKCEIMDDEDRIKNTV